MEIDNLYNWLNVYNWLNGNCVAKDVIFLLQKVTGYSIQYCSQILQENNNNFLITYKKIIEDQFKKTLNN